MADRDLRRLVDDVFTSSSGCGGTMKALRARGFVTPTPSQARRPPTSNRRLRELHTRASPRSRDVPATAPGLAFRARCR